MGSEEGATAEGQKPDVTTPREPAAAEETTPAAEDTESTETAGAEDSGLDNDPLQAGAEPELGSEVE
jgi:hypothetical protein